MRVPTYIQKATRSHVHAHDTLENVDISLGSVYEKLLARKDKKRQRFLLLLYLALVNEFPCHVLALLSFK